MKAKPRKTTAKRAAVARKAHMALADAYATKVQPTIKAIQRAGITTPSGIAAALNARRILTPRGKNKWRAVQVIRLLARLT